MPLGGYALLDAGKLWLRGFVASADGQQMIGGELTGEQENAEDIGRQLADQLRARGADALLACLSSR